MQIRRWFPGAILAGSQVIVASLLFFVPETFGRDLPEHTREIDSWPLSLSKEDRRKARQEFTWSNLVRGGKVPQNKVEDLPTVDKCPSDKGMAVSTETINTYI